MSEHVDRGRRAIAECNQFLSLIRIGFAEAKEKDIPIPHWIPESVEIKERAIDRMQVKLTKNNFTQEDFRLLAQYNETILRIHAHLPSTS